MSVPELSLLAISTTTTTAPLTTVDTEFENVQETPGIERLPASSPSPTPPGPKPRPSLLTIASELRNLIWTHALRHDCNGGWIAPAGPNVHRIVRNGSSIDTIFEGEAQRLFPYERLGDDIQGIIVRPHAAHINIHRSDSDSDSDCDSDAELQFSGHLCTMQCVKQPALTKASRQVRDEALSIFYSENKFHINPEALERTGWPPYEVRERWRAIQDTNLRSMTYLSIMYAREWFQGFTYRAATKGQDGSVVYHIDVPRAVSLGKGGQPPGATEAFEEPRRQMEEGGVFVRGIERVLALGELEPDLGEGVVW